MCVTGHTLGGPIAGIITQKLEPNCSCLTFGKNYMEMKWEEEEVVLEEARHTSCSCTLSLAVSM